MGTGIDWQSMLTQLQEVSEQSLTPYNNEITSYNSQISAWQSFAGDLNTLQTASAALDSNTSLDVFTTNLTSSSSTSASSLLSATASSSAGTGSYEVVVNNVAQAEKLASSDFSSETSALNISGTILVNGQAVQIASTDTLQDLQTKINQADTGTTASGVTATIVQDSPTSWRLELTSDNTGASGISLLNGSASDTLGTLGFNGAGTSIKNQVTGGAQSDGFTSSSTGVAALLGTSSLSGPVIINGIQVVLDTTDSLQTIASDLDSAGIQASVVSSTNGSQTTYRLSIANMTSYTDSNNVLESLGLIQGNRPDVVGVTGSVANTTDGSTPITASTDIANIFGYTNNSGDAITISGTTHDGTAVASTNFAINSNTTVGDLLNEIQSLFGNVTAQVTSDGKIQVIDNTTGTSQFSVNLTSAIGSNSGTLSFGSFGQAGTISQRVLQQGTNAAFTVDGMSMTSTSNTVTNAISGITLNLLGEDPNTTVTVNVDHDVSGIESKINSMISAYNAVISYVDAQMTYNADTNTTGGPLFGDNTLKSVKWQLQSAILNPVGTGSLQYLADIGITTGENGQLSLDTTTFEQALSSNFQGVVNLLSDSGVSSNSQFQYVYNTSSTQAGTYNVTVSQLPGTDQDIAGQIDGYDAVGQGNTLTLNNSASNANGLQVSYTGNTQGDSATITVTRGIASLIAGLASQFTDPVNGAVTEQQNGLQTRIQALNQQVSNMQAGINSQMASYQQEFINMDTAVAQMDSMESYLSTQLSKL
jgi:flagellar hook-associated protein 2